LITSLSNSASQEFTKHHSKEALLWEAYKDRLGASNFSNMQLILHELLPQPFDLLSLKQHITKEEIVGVILFETTSS